MMIDQMLKQEIRNIELKELPADYPTMIPSGGFLLKLNTPPEGLVNFSFNKKVGLTGFGMPYGIKNGKYCFSLYVSTDGSPLDYDDLKPKKDARYDSPEKTWQLYKNSLLEGDLSGAANCLEPNYGMEFIKIYEAIGKDEFKKIAAGMEAIGKIRQDENTAKYRIKRKENDQEVTYYIHFVNLEGNWKIESF